MERPKIKDYLISHKIEFHSNMYKYCEELERYVDHLENMKSGRASEIEKLIPGYNKLKHDLEFDAKHPRTKFILENI